MNLQRMIGLVLFWGGFLTAAVCMVLQREVDLLPAAERQVLLQLPPKFSVSVDEARRWSQQPISELATEEFVPVLRNLEAWWLAQQASEASPPDTDAESTRQEQANAALPSVPTAATTEQASIAERLPAPLTKDHLIKRRVARLASRWPAVYWPGYLAAVLVGICGAVAIRVSVRTATGNESNNQAGLDQMRAALRALVTQVDGLVSSLPTLSPEETVAWIDTHCVPLCGDFADNREVMKRTIGLEGFAAVMSEFASGERFLNRVWSAAADGYMDEAWRSLQTSQRFFQAALHEFQKRTP